MRKSKVWLAATAKSINAFMTVPMYAALLSIFIAVIPPLQAFLNKLEPFERAIKGAGACSSESFRLIWQSKTDIQFRSRLSCSARS